MNCNNCLNFLSFYTWRDIFKTHGSKKNHHLFNFSSFRFHGTFFVLRSSF